jgi:Domain of unknown function (DUF4440)
MTRTTVAKEVGFSLFVCAGLLIGFGCGVKRPESAVGVVSTGVQESGANPNATQESLKSTVLENEKKIWEGFKARDANAIGALLSDNIQVVTPDGRFTKSQFLEIVRQLPEISNYKITNARCRNSHL